MVACRLVLASWGKQPCDHVEEDSDEAGKQGEGDQSEADHGRVEAAIIGDARGDAHHLAVVTIDHETIGHEESPLRAFRHAIGSEVAADTRRSAEMKEPARTVAVLRAEAKVENIG